MIVTWRGNGPFEPVVRRRRWRRRCDSRGRGARCGQFRRSRRRLRRCRRDEGRSPRWARCAGRPGCQARGEAGCGRWCPRWPAGRSRAGSRGRRV
ncbi:MAG TPA: hypothetical protein DEP84_29925, partial [Chloroflexi bacterium]|nr:hypothetical protein [Chloroflexota bacterium]